MSEAVSAGAGADPAELLPVPRGGWTVDHLDAFPESHRRYELTDGALTVSPTPSSLHQVLVMHLGVRLDGLVPDRLVATQGVEIRFGRQLTRVPDVLVVRSDEPGRHWFAPAEVVLAVEIESPGSHLDDRVLKPALYADHGIPHFWRFELDPPRVVVHGVGPGDRYRVESEGERLTVAEPVELDVAVAELLPRWAR